MSIHGIDNSGLVPIRPQPPQESGSTVPQDVSAQGTNGASPDRVEISPEARALAAQSSADIGTPPTEHTLSTDQMHRVLDRLASGFYDQPEVQDVVAQRAAIDLQNL